MNPELLYYLSHPYTTYGSAKFNKVKAKLIEHYIAFLYGIKMVNPICTLPLMDDEAAMAKCHHLYLACDAVILCPGWPLSKGCKEEAEWAIRDQKPRFYYRKGLIHRVPK